MEKFKKNIKLIVMVLVSMIFATTLGLILCFTLPDRPSIGEFIAMTLVLYLCFLWVFEEKGV